MTRPYTPFLISQEHNVINVGEFFGCYEDNERLENVLCVSDSFIIKMSRKNFSSLGDSAKIIMKYKIQSLMKAFPDLNGTVSDEILNLVNKGTILKAKEQDILVQSKNRLSVLNYEDQPEDQLIYIVAEGSCQTYCEIDYKSQ